MNGRPYNGEKLEYLKSMGYKQTSRKYRTACRVDLSDDEMKDFFIKKNFGSKKSGLPSLPLEDQKDHYRRCYTQDSIEGIPESILKHLR